MVKVGTDGKLSKEELAEAKKTVAVEGANEAQAKEDLPVSQLTIIRLHSAFAEKSKEVKGASTQPQAPGASWTLSVDEAIKLTDLHSETAFGLNHWRVEGGERRK